MATRVEMAVPDHRGPYPYVIIQDLEDAREFVRILQKNKIAVNIREVPAEEPSADEKAREDRRIADLANRVEQFKKNYPGTSLDI